VRVNIRSSIYKAIGVCMCVCDREKTRKSEIESVNVKSSIRKELEVCACVCAHMCERVSEWMSE